MAIAGCGHIAKKHAAALMDMDTARLAAVCDIRQERAESLAGRYGAAAYGDYDQMLQDKNIDAVIVCSPSGLHAAMGEQAAAAGKHVLIEKPFVLRPADGVRLVEACRQNGVRLGVVHPNRMKPIVQALRKAVDNGLFGKITHAAATLRWNRRPEYYRSEPWRGTRAFDGGILYNQAVHLLDLLNWLAGPVSEVFAYRATRMHKIECEDVLSCVLKFSSGALGLIEAAVTVYPENLEETLAIFGAEGTAVLGGRTMSQVKEWMFSSLSGEEAVNQASKLNQTGNAVGHRDILHDFVDALLCNREPLVSGREALQSLRLISAIYDSAARHRPVQVTMPGGAQNE
ncbi:MAG: Gfo/Idh/MocA family oxidoreductase [Desulfotomaculaceae bacterium]|nr:Gfo/Idh/MocA family oxidoreductase [Desulfotomaculaceae bacterium]